MLKKLILFTGYYRSVLGKNKENILKFKTKVTIGYTNTSLTYFVVLIAQVNRQLM